MSAVVMVVDVVFVIVSREGCHGYRRRTPVVEVAIDVVVIIVLNSIVLVAWFSRQCRLLYGDKNGQVQWRLAGLLG